MNRALIDACCEAMDQGSMSSRDGVEVIAIGKQLERVGDYAANIAGDVVYMLTGE
jgi:phosphate uptake regulator